MISKKLKVKYFEPNLKKSAVKIKQKFKTQNMCSEIYPVP